MTFIAKILKFDFSRLNLYRRYRRQDIRRGLEDDKQFQITDFFDDMSNAIINGMSTIASYRLRLNLWIKMTDLYGNIAILGGAMYSLLNVIVEGLRCPAGAIAIITSVVLGMLLHLISFTLRKDRLQLMEIDNYYQGFNEMFLEEIERSRDDRCYWDAETGQRKKCKPNKKKKNHFDDTLFQI